MPRRNERVTIDYQITFQAPFHLGTGLPAGLIHRSVQRDPQGYLMVPGSTIKGAVRAQCEAIAHMFGLEVASPHDPQDLTEFRTETSPIPALFGTRRRPGTLFFDDAKLSESGQAFFSPDQGAPSLEASYRSWQVEERTQVSLSRLTRAAKPGALYASEYGIKGMTFAGRIYGAVEEWPLLYQETTFGVLLLVAGLLAVDCLGGNRSSGTGRCAVTISSVTANGVRLIPAKLLESLEEFALYDTIIEEG